MERAVPRHRTVTLQQISEALIASGYRSLDEQAKALGIHRSTAWTIIKTKHKLGRLSAKTTSRILANPETPPTVRAVVLRYLTERGESRFEDHPQHHSRSPSDRAEVQESHARTP
jgi:hypothetical protein